MAGIEHRQMFCVVRFGQEQHSGIEGVHDASIDGFLQWS